MNSKVPKYSTISTNIWAELLHEIDDDDDDIDDDINDDDDATITADSG